MDAESLGLNSKAECEAFIIEVNKRRSMARLLMLGYEPCADSSLPDAVASESGLPPLECMAWDIRVVGYYAPESLFQGDGWIMM